MLARKRMNPLLTALFVGFPFPLPRYVHFFKTESIVWRVEDDCILRHGFSIRIAIAR